MVESAEREQYRMRCKYYSFESGHCYKQSSVCLPRFGFPRASMIAFVDINCTSDADCARMRRYDKNNGIPKH